MSAIAELESQVDTCVQLFLSRLRDSASSRTPLDVDNWLQYYSFDCLGVLSFSQDIGFLSSKNDVGSMIHAVDTIFDYVALVSRLNSGYDCGCKFTDSHPDRPDTDT